MGQVPLIDMPPKEPLKGSICVSYKGEATKTHSMDAELYARSLLGFSKSFRRANKNIFQLKMSLEIKAERPGSYEAIINFLTSDAVEATAISLGVLQFFGIDFKTISKAPICLYRLVIQLIKKAKGKKKEIRKELAKLELPQEVELKLIKLIENNDFRSCLDEMTFFLQTNGMESLQIKAKNQEPINISKHERRYFVTNPEDDETVEYDNKVVSISYLSPEKSKWQFKSGSTEFWAEVADLHFLDEMQDKALEDIQDLQFTASVEKTTVKKALTKKVEISRRIYDFKNYEPERQLKFDNM